MEEEVVVVEVVVVGGMEEEEEEEEVVVVVVVDVLVACEETRVGVGECVVVVVSGELFCSLSCSL